MSMRISLPIPIPISLSVSDSDCLHLYLCLYLELHLSIYVCVCTVSCMCTYVLWVNFRGCCFSYYYCYYHCCHCYITTTSTTTLQWLGVLTNITWTLVRTMKHTECRSSGRGGWWKRSVKDRGSFERNESVWNLGSRTPPQVSRNVAMEVKSVRALR